MRATGWAGRRGARRCASTDERRQKVLPLRVWRRDGPRRPRETRDRPVPTRPRPRRATSNARVRRQPSPRAQHRSGRGGGLPSPRARRFALGRNGGPRSGRAPRTRSCPSDAPARTRRVVFPGSLAFRRRASPFRTQLRRACEGAEGGLAPTRMAASTACAPPARRATPSADDISLRGLERESLFVPRARPPSNPPRTCARTPRRREPHVRAPASRRDCRGPKTTPSRDGTSALEAPAPCSLFLGPRPSSSFSSSATTATRRSRKRQGRGAVRTGGRPPLAGEGSVRGAWLARARGEGEEVVTRPTNWRRRLALEDPRRAIGRPVSRHGRSRASPRADRRRWERGGAVLAYMALATAKAAGVRASMAAERVGSSAAAAQRRRRPADATRDQLYDAPRRSHRIRRRADPSWRGAMGRATSCPACGDCRRARRTAGGEARRLEANAGERLLRASPTPNPPVEDPNSSMRVRYAA